MADNKEILKSRIEKELHKFSLSEEDVAKVTQYYLDSFFIKDRYKDSHLFAFEEKVTAVVHAFEPQGLTLPEYLKAAVKQPQLFSQSPDKIINHVQKIVEHFKRDGLKLPSYLKAAVKQPQLFYQSPDKIIRNIQDVVDYFKDDGLILFDYLNRAAVKKPALFSQSPDKIISNIEAVVTRFKDDGLTLPEYLRAAIKQPQLFSQCPDTIIGHINAIIDMYKQNIIAFGNKQESSPKSLEPVFDFLLKNPATMCWSYDNFALRKIYSQVTKAVPSRHILTTPRGTIENELSAALGHPDLSIVVPKIVETGNKDSQSWANNVMLRALITEGLIKKGRLSP